jgi:hypothetical protein
MKASALLKLFVVPLSAAFLFFGANVALAQVDGGDSDDGTEGLLESLSETAVVGGAPTYQVGYMHSTTISPRRAMAISITNNSTQSCDTTVRWRAGGGQLIGTSSIVIPAGQTFEHCSRDIASATVICNVISSPPVQPPQFIEGRADVHIATACQDPSNIDAKQYYMTGSSDTSIAGVHRPATIRGTTYRGD